MIGGRVENLEPVYDVTEPRIYGEGLKQVNHSGMFGGMLAIVATASFFLAGFETIPQGIEEAGGKTKNVGKMVVLSVALACIFYAFLLFAFGLGWDWKEFAVMPRPAAASLFLCMYPGGVGRALYWVLVLGALAGEMLLEHKVSHGLMSLVYMGLLVLAVVLLYRLFLLYAEAWKHSAVEKSLAKVKAETNAVSFANAATGITVNANAYVSEKTAAQTLANSFSEAGLAENNKDTTATENVTAMSADNFAGINLETVADEAEDSELYASEFAEEVAEDYFSNMISEKDAETQNSAASRVASSRAAVSHAAASRVAEPEEAKGTSDSPSATEDVIKTDLSLPDESGPLHGDRLRKYQLRYRLTNRETEVLWEILLKHKTAEIAANLVITIPTAKYHISNILQKTGMRNQRELRYLISKEEN